jgi:RNA-directed DNA polymerase
VAEAIVRRKTRVLDFDLRSYFDNIRHDRLLEKVAVRVDDGHHASCEGHTEGLRQEGRPSRRCDLPLLSNLYLNEVDRMLEKAKEVTRQGRFTYIEYARFADDLVILIDAYARHDWLMGAVDKRLREEFDKLRVEINDEKSSIVDLGRGSFGFLGFDFRYLRGMSGKWRPHYTPKLKSGRRYCERSKMCSPPPVSADRSGDQSGQSGHPRVGELLRRGHSSECFSFIKDCGEEGQAPYGAGSETTGLRLEAME